MVEPKMSARMLPAEKEESIREAAAALAEGGLVAIPTETVYGLAADAWNPEAVAAIFETKRRPAFDPLIVHIAGFEDLGQVAASWDSRAESLAKRFWPGPLTLVLPRSDRIPDLVTSGLPMVAVRVPDHPAALQLLKILGRPLAAPSANLFGTVSPTTAEHVRAQMGDVIPLILDGGSCRVGVESTILSLAGGKSIILRPGGVSREELESVLGQVDVESGSKSLPVAPGQLESHYAPRTPLRLLGSRKQPRGGSNVGLLAFKAAPVGVDFAAVEVLSAQGDLREAATNLFAALRRLDEKGLKEIQAESVPETGLGLAIMDRLKRASAR
jgi:L-threonylcarbamoyladenylate synthase